MSATKGIFRVSSQLHKVIGVHEVKRTEALKKVWAYFKEHDLQDKEKKSEINCDAVLQEVFGKSKIHMTEVMKLMGPHLEADPEVVAKKLEAARKKQEKESDPEFIARKAELAKKKAEKESKIYEIVQAEMAKEMKKDKELKKEQKEASKKEVKEKKTPVKKTTTEKKKKVKKEEMEEED